MNRLFDDAFRSFGMPALAGFDRAAGWPHVELGESDEEIRVTAELPGLDEKDVEITVEDGALTLRGEKRSEVADKDRGYTERSYGRFERRIGLPQGIDRDHAAATFRNGVLTLTLPKTEAANENVRRIPVNGKAADDLARDFGSGPSANDNHTGSSASRALPADARAVIEPVPCATNQGGLGGRGQWRVRFAPRWRPVADPLTGWTGGGDPLETIELRFLDAETAASYCPRQGLDFSLHGAPGRQHPLPCRLPAEPTPVLCCWPSGPHARCCGRYPAALESALGSGSAVGVGGMAFSHSP